MRAEALDSEGPSDADLLLVLVGFVVEVNSNSAFAVIERPFLLAGDAYLPPFGVEFFDLRSAIPLRFTWNFPFLPRFLTALFSFSRSGSSFAPLVPDDIDLRVVCDRARRDMVLAHRRNRDGYSVDGIELGTVLLISASLRWPSRESASR